MFSSRSCRDLPAVQHGCSSLYAVRTPTVPDMRGRALLRSRKTRVKPRISQGLDLCSFVDGTSAHRTPWDGPTRTRESKHPMIREWYKGPELHQSWLKRAEPVELGGRGAALRLDPTASRLDVDFYLSLKMRVGAVTQKLFLNGKLAFTESKMRLHGLNKTCERYILIITDYSRTRCVHPYELYDTIPYGVTLFLTFYPIRPCRRRRDPTSDRFPFLLCSWSWESMRRSL